MGKSISILINHEDHLRIQCVYPGANILKAYNEVIALERQFEKDINFAFDNELGYLTTNPANLGTGLKIAITAHLPALSINPGIADFIKNLTRVGCSISGYFGGNTDIIGNLFKIFSRKALGKSEEEIVEEMQAICLNIIDEERNIRNDLLVNDLLGVKDNVYRSYGLLKYAKILSYEESLELLSILRLGLDLKIISEVRDFDFFEIINIVSDSHIILNYEINEDITDDKLDAIRADLIRKRVLRGKDRDV
jgi:protein arginine kinase